MSVVIRSFPLRLCHGGGADQTSVTPEDVRRIDVLLRIRQLCGGLDGEVRHTETCFPLSEVYADRSQSAHRSARVIPASRAIRSISAGQA